MSVVFYTLLNVGIFLNVDRSASLSSLASWLAIFDLARIFDPSAGC